MGLWYARKRCIECHAILIPTNTVFTLSKSKLYPRPVCSLCHREQCRLSMRRVRDRRVRIEPVRGGYPQFREWQRGLAREVREVSKQ